MGNVVPGKFGVVNLPVFSVSLSPGPGASRLPSDPRPQQAQERSEGEGEGRREGEGCEGGVHRGPQGPEDPVDDKVSVENGLVCLLALAPSLETWLYSVCLSLSLCLCLSVSLSLCLSQAGNQCSV